MPVIIISDEDEMVAELQKAEETGRIVIIDFTATWCGPCKRMAPLFDSLSKMYQNAVFLKVDVDQCAEITSQFDISAMPTFLFLRKNQEIDRITGADPEQLEKRVHTWSSSVTLLPEISYSTVENQRESQPQPQQPQQQKQPQEPGNQYQHYQPYSDLRYQNGQRYFNHNYLSQSYGYDYNESQIQSQSQVYSNDEKTMPTSALGTAQPPPHLAPMPPPPSAQQTPNITNRTGGAAVFPTNQQQIQRQLPQNQNQKQNPAYAHTNAPVVAAQPHQAQGGNIQRAQQPLQHPHIIPHPPLHQPGQQPQQTRNQIFPHAPQQQQQQQQRPHIIPHGPLSAPPQRNPEQHQFSFNSGGNHPDAGAHFPPHAPAQQVAFAQEHHPIAAAYNHIVAANSAHTTALSGNQGKAQRPGPPNGYEQQQQFASDTSGGAHAQMQSPDTPNHNYITMAPSTSVRHPADQQRTRRRSRSSTRASANGNSKSKSGKSDKPLSPVDVLLQTNKKNEALAQKAIGAKKRLPMSTVTIHMADGTKAMANFNTSQPVSKIRDFIQIARPSITRPFVIMTAFPSKEIANETLSIKDAQLINSVLVQKLK